jgi:hypothetical protein
MEISNKADGWLYVLACATPLPTGKYDPEKFNKMPTATMRPEPQLAKRLC